MNMTKDEQDAKTAARIADLMAEPTPYEWEVVSAAASKAIRAARIEGARHALVWAAKKCEFMAEVLPDKAVGAIAQLNHVREMCQKADPAAVLKEQP